MLKKKNFPFEDCGQAIGAKVNNKFVGSFGDIAAFSTMYRKNLAEFFWRYSFTKNYNLYKNISICGQRKKYFGRKFDFRDPGNSIFLR